MIRSSMRRRRFLASSLGLLACGSESAAPDEAIHEPPRRNSFRLLTYNVLADAVHLDQRLPAVFRTMRETDADVIALQEVAPWFLEAARRERGLSAYSFCEVADRGADRGGQAFLSKVDVRAPYSIDLPGRQERTALLAEVHLGGPPLVIATTHMESFLEDGPTRAAQLDMIFGALNRRSAPSRSSACVLCGDLNFGDGEEPETAQLDDSYLDVWNALRPGDAGYTWDIERSEMARAGSFVGEGSRRLDRVLLRSEEWRGESINIVGNAPANDDRRVFPSDHFGLLCELRRC